MSTNNRPEKTLTFRLTGEGSACSLELMNLSEQTLRCIEVLTVFLRDEEPQAHIKFESLTALQPQQTAVVRHRTWTDGKPVDASLDNKLERLRVVAGQASPYVLHISWDDAEGKKRFQRIGAGH